MKTLKKLLTVFMVLLLFISNSAMSLIAEAEMQLPDDFFINQDNALLLREQLFDEMPRSRSGDLIFPDYYGGHFIDENGNLVVNIVGTTVVAHGASALDSTIVHFSVSTRDVPFSYNDLHYVMDVISMYRQANPDCHLGIIYHMTCVIGNNVFVGIYEYNERVKNYFKRYVIDTPIVTFRIATPLRVPTFIQDDAFYAEFNDINEMTPFNARTTSIFPGDRIATRFGPMSAGYAVMRGGQGGL